VREVEGQGRAKFNFTAQTPMELSLIKGNERTFDSCQKFTDKKDFSSKKEEDTTKAFCQLSV
jgi:hypothetical protein